MPVTNLNEIEFCPAEAGTDALSTSEYYRLLAADRRETTLAVLLERSAPIDLQDLATAVAKRERDVGTPGESFVRRVATTLHHLHLPLMADLGVVEYDPAAREIRSCPHPTDAGEE